MVVPTRSEALENLKSYVKYSGANYRSNRNYAEKLGTRQNVSSLSPYIRYRLISEEEVILQVLTQNSYSAAEKFIQEVFWRTYWKGWMQLRPHLYDVYVDEVHYSETFCRSIAEAIANRLADSDG